MVNNSPNITKRTTTLIHWTKKGVPQYEIEIELFWGQNLIDDLHILESILNLLFFVPELFPIR